MNAKPYQVHLDLFEGPLDLLLYLIKKDDLEITEIPIAEITREYLAYLELLKELNLEMAGEFLVTASTLMQIKARTLLPAPPAEDEGPDPRAELINKLQEYAKFKGAAGFLNGQGETYKDVHYRGAPRFRAEEKTLDTSLFDLMRVLQEALDRVPESRSVEGEEFPIEQKMDKILFLLDRAPRLALAEVFADERKRGGIVACFLAMLELIKTQKVLARQERQFGPVYIFRRTVAESAQGSETPADAAGASEPETGPAAEGASAGAPDARVPEEP